MTRISREKTKGQALAELLAQFEVLIDDPRISLKDLDALRQAVEGRINEVIAERDLGKRENELETL